MHGETSFLGDLKAVHQAEEQRVRDDKVPAIAQRWAVGRKAGGRRLPLHTVPCRARAQITPSCGEEGLDGREVLQVGIEVPDQSNARAPPKPPLPP